MERKELWFVSGFICGMLLLASFWLVSWHEHDSEWCVEGASRRQKEGMIIVVGQRDEMVNRGASFEVLHGSTLRNQHLIIVNFADAKDADILQQKLRAAINDGH